MGNSGDIMPKRKKLMRGRENIIHLDVAVGPRVSDALDIIPRY